MAIDVTMPKLSDTMEEGKIVQWLKHPGDKVAIGDVLAEVETDKATMELEAYDEGVLSEVRVGEGESAPVGTVIAVLAGPGEAKPAPEAKAAAEAKPVPGSEAKPAPSAEAKSPPATHEKAAPEPPRAAERAPAEAASPRPTPGPAAREGARSEAARGETWRPTVVRRPEPAAEPQASEGERRIKASPLARRIAREHGLDLATVTGTGPEGRIVEKDVEIALERPRERPAADTAKRGAPPAAEPAREAGARPERRIDLSRLRRTTAKRMAEAKREIPHFYASADIRMDEAVRLKEALAGLGGDFVGVTYTHLIIKAAGIALTRVPEVNAAYDGDALVLHDAVNIGVATAVEAGLIVPVVHDCARQPLAAIAKRVRELVERAKAGRFAGDDLSGATFTVSNLGMFPVSQFAAVINLPQAAILAVGAIRDVPVVEDGRIVPGRLMTVTLSCDHRVIDGVLAARFLRELKALLEQPVALVV